MNDQRGRRSVVLQEEGLSGAVLSIFLCNSLFLHTHSLRWFHSSCMFVAIYASPSSRDTPPKRGCHVPGKIDSGKREIPPLPMHAHLRTRVHVPWSLCLSASFGTQLFCQKRCKARFPLPNRLIYEHPVALQKYLRKITQTELVTQAKDGRQAEQYRWDIPGSWRESHCVIEDASTSRTVARSIPRRGLLRLFLCGRRQTVWTVHL